MDILKDKNRWMYLLAAVSASCLYIASAGLSNCLGLFYKSLAASIGSGIGAVSLCVTMGSVVTGFAAKLMPVILKKFPFRGIVGAGMLLIAGGIAAGSRAASVPFLALCFFAKGLGGCLIGMTTINFLVDNWFYTGSGTVLGTGMSMSGIVAAVLSPCFSRLIEGRGWQTAMVVLACLSALFCIPALTVSAKPEKRGLRPFGGKNEEAKQTSGAEKTEAPALKKDFTYYAVIGLMFLITACFCMVLHIATFASSAGLSPTAGALMLSANMIANMLFKLVMGYLCDRINPIRASLISYSCVALAFLLFIAGTRVAWVNFVGAAFLGAVYFSSTLAVGQIIKMLYDRALFSRIYATALMVSSIASAVFGVLTGYAYDWFGSYLPALCTFFVLSGIAIALLISLNRQYRMVQTAKAR